MSQTSRRKRWGMVWLCGLLCICLGQVGPGPANAGKKAARRSAKKPKPAKRSKKRGRRVSKVKARKIPIAAAKSLVPTTLEVATPRNPAEAKAMKKLARKIKRALRSRRLRGAKLGVVVMAEDGRVLYAHKATKPYIPASNLKLITIAAALKYLGYHYRFKTTIHADKPIDEKGVLDGNLYIKGGGDPSFRSEELWRVVRDLHLKGLRKVTGRVIFDDSVFDRKRFGAGWTDHSNQPREKYRPYLAPIGGLALNFSTFAIGVRPGSKVGDEPRVAIDPNCRYFRKIINKATTISEGGRFKLRFKILPHRGYRDIVEISGTVPMKAKSKSFWRRINFPGWYAGFQFAAFLYKEKIKVNRWVRRGKVPPNAIELYKHYSPPLGQILQYVGKQSSNFTSEQILKTIGSYKYGLPGTWAKGLRAVKAYLKELGIAPASYVMINGSGLSRTNQISPYLFATLMRKMLGDFRLRSEFLAAQATSGLDGTLRWRMRKRFFRGKIRGKTGTLDGVSSLGGFVLTQDKKILVFSILMNGRLRQGRYFRKAQNKIGKILAKYPKM